jgi:CHAT domain-containing protein
MRRAYDIVHLSGHGIVTDKGPRLIMEDELGAHEEISPEQLLKVFRAGRVMPRLVVLSSCHTAEQRSDLPSLAAELIQGGLHCVVGWTRPVGDGTATLAAAELYQRLCSGEVPTQALARARQRLHGEDVARPSPTHAWATLQLLTTRPAGFAIDPERRRSRG